jgi:hypothetical protein
MEFKILEQQKKPKTTNTFVIRLKFMENDADNFTTVGFDIPEEKLSDPEYNQEVEKFITHINECIRMDSSGRGGIDSGKDLHRRYDKVENWSKYCANVYEDYYVPGEPDAQLEDEDNYDENWGYHIPTDTYGSFYNSYYDCTIVYFDNNGDEFPVSVEM